MVRVYGKRLAVQLFQVSVRLRTQGLELFDELVHFALGSPRLRGCFLLETRNQVFSGV